MLHELADLGVEHIVVGGAAAILQGAPILTGDLDLVHRRTPENVGRLVPWLLSHDAYNRADLANRRLRPKEEWLLGRGHILLQTDLGKLDLLCELAEGEGYEEILLDTVVITAGTFDVRVLGLERLIAVKARAGRIKDKAVLPVLIATLEHRRGKEKP
jgi:predicted nucleotidyltransferase